MVSDEVVILDVLQNQFPVVLPFPHPIRRPAYPSPWGFGGLDRIGFDPSVLDRSFFLIFLYLIY